MKNLDQLTNGNLPVSDIKIGSNNKDERLDYKPFKFIPNVKKMRVELSEEDPLFAKYDINKKVEKAKLVYEKFENEHFNRYARHQLKRLNRANSKTY